MSLSGEQDDISRTALIDHIGDGVAPALDYLAVGLSVHAAQNIADYRPGILGAAVVAGDDRIIGQLRRRRAHQRTLRFVPVAAASEQHAEPSAGLLPLRQGEQGFFQRVGRMSVVDVDLDSAVAGDVEPLHPPRNLRTLRQCAADYIRLYAKHTGGADGGQGIINGKFAWDRTDDPIESALFEQIVSDSAVIGGAAGIFRDEIGVLAV